MPKGTVKWYDRKKGFGYIETEDGNDIYVHSSSIRGDGMRSLHKGDRVIFDYSEGKKGPTAVCVQLTGDRSSQWRRAKKYQADNRIPAPGNQRYPHE